MPMGLREAAQGRSRRERNVVLPISGLTVHLVAMNRREHREYTQMLRAGDAKAVKLKEKYSNELLCNRCALDVLGKPEFTDDEILNGALDGMDAADFVAMFSAVLSLMAADADAVEDAIKNSTRTGSSALSGGLSGPTESPSTNSTTDLMMST